MIFIFHRGRRENSCVIRRMSLRFDTGTKADTFKHLTAPRCQILCTLRKNRYLHADTMLIGNRSLFISIWLLFTFSPLFVTFKLLQITFPHFFLLALFALIRVDASSKSGHIKRMATYDY